MSKQVDKIHILFVANPLLLSCCSIMNLCRAYNFCDAQRLSLTKREKRWVVHSRIVVLPDAQKKMDCRTESKDDNISFDWSRSAGNFSPWLCYWLEIGCQPMPSTFCFWFYDSKLAYGYFISKFPFSVFVIKLRYWTPELHL